MKIELTEEQQGEIMERVKAAAAEEAAMESRRQVSALWRDVLREEVRAFVREELAAVFNAPVQPTNRLGEPDGPPRSLQSFAIAEVRATLDMKVDPETGAPPRESWRQTILLREWLIREAVKKGCSQAISLALVAALEKEGVRR